MLNRQFSSASQGSIGSQVVDQGLRSYMLRVYNYMTCALIVTGLVAWFSSQSQEFVTLMVENPLRWVVMFAPLGMVFFLSARIHKLSNTAAQASFWAFSALMGLSLFYVFALYTGVSITRVFFITSIMFGSMSLYGYTTKKDISGWGSFLFMGMIGLIVASIVNIFLQSPALHFAVSFIGVLIFAGLTAYDTQKIKEMYYQFAGTDFEQRSSILGALQLYLDFINMFVFLLQLFGSRE